MLTEEKPRITIRGYLDGESSYGFITEKVTNALISKGWDPSILPVVTSGDAKVPKVVSDCLVRKPQQDKWELVLHPPDYQWTPGKKAIFLTMWEASRLKQSHLRCLNDAQAVIVPSDYNVNSFSASGVNTRIFKVPLGVNTKAFRYSPYTPNKTFTVNAAGKLHGVWVREKFKPLDDRKNFPAIIKAFKSAFPFAGPNDVRLRIKMFPGTNVWTGLEDDERIEVIQQHWGERELANFYATSDCFISASKMEGWGWMQQESMAMGRPVIAPIVGGLSEFMTPENSYSVDFDYENPTKFYEGCGLWAKPSIASMVKQLKRARRNREEIASKGIQAAQSASYFTNELFADNLDRALRKIINDKP